jgi:hypothetical protein
MRPPDHCNTVDDFTSRRRNGTLDARTRSRTTMTTFLVEEQGAMVEDIEVVVEEGAHQTDHHLERPPVMSA